MDRHRHAGLRLPACLLLLLTWNATSASAQEAPQEAPATRYDWQSATELSYVSTGGNASSSTLGVKASMTGTRGPNKLKFELGGIRASSDFTTRTATGTADDFTVTETVRSETTAESYFLRGRYDRTFGPVFTFAGAGWDRNTFAGIKNRVGVVAGMGRAFVEGEQGHLRADLGFTYTIQKDVDPAPGADDSFGGLRFSVEAMRRLSETAQVATEISLDDNIEDTDDLRADWMTSVAVAINAHLALKTSLQLLWDNRPALIGVPLLTTGGLPTGTNVLTVGEELDKVMTLTLVITL